MAEQVVKPRTQVETVETYPHARFSLAAIRLVVHEVNLILNYISEPCATSVGLLLPRDSVMYRTELRKSSRKKRGGVLREDLEAIVAVPEPAGAPSRLRTSFTAHGMALCS